MIIGVLVRTSAVLAAGLALSGLLRRSSAALRHIVVAVTLACAALVVPGSFVLPAWQVASSHAAPSAAAPHLTTVAGAAVPSAPRAAAARTPPPMRAPVAIWTAGFLAVIGMLAAGMLRLRQIAARSTPVEALEWREAARTIGAAYGLRRDVVLMEGESPFVVATWGIRPARVLLPSSASGWSATRIRAVLSHELAHVARADWPVQIAAQVVLAALWFHPLAWLACRQLRRESERACDDAVLRHGVDAPEYAGHLLALARVCRRPSWSAWMPALPMARPSAFERRIAAMLNPRVDRRPLSRRTATILGAALVAVSSVIAAAHDGQIPGALSGTVYDASGGVFPGVTLTLSAPQGPAVQATTDPAGRFAFPGIGPGHYALSAAVPGFHTLREEFDLKTAPDWDRAVTLQVGTLRETIHVSATRTATAPSAAAATRIRVGGNIKVPMKLVDVKPVYPESMRAEGREAEVQLEATIAPDGSVSSVHVTSAQIHPDFAIAAIDAVRQWRFSPTLLNGKPIEVVMTVTVGFSLSN